MYRSIFILLVVQFVNNLISLTSLSMAGTGLLRKVERLPDLFFVRVKYHGGGLAFR
jgi:hypothetical protein